MKNLCIFLCSLFCFPGATIFAVQGEFITNPDALRKQYKYLYNLPVVLHPDGSKTFHQAKLIKHQGINLLYLKGDRFEMAFQHAKLLRQEILQGALPEAADLVYNAVGQLLVDTPIIHNFVYNIVDRNYATVLLRNAIDNAGSRAQKHLQPAFAFGEILGYGTNRVLDAGLGNSVLMLLAADRIPEVESKNIPRLPMNNCSEFAAWGSYTEDGELIIGRNTDYPLHGPFEDHHTVMYFNPTDGGQKTMSIMSAGLHMAGVTAYNESGIYLGSHTIPTRDVSMEGTPMFFAINEILANSHTLDEAVAALKKIEPDVGWTYVLASTKEKRILSFELSASGFGIRNSEGETHFQTNHFVTDSMRERNMFINKSVSDETLGRFQRLGDLMSTHKGAINPQVAAQVMSDQYDPIAQKISGLGATIGVITTVSSIIFKPSANKFYVASGHAPASHTTYVAVPTIETFDPENFASNNMDVIQNSSFADNHPQKLAAMRRYVDAKKEYEFNLAYDKAYKIMKNVVQLDSENPGYAFTYGILALRNSQFTAAKNIFEKMLQNLPPSHHRDLALYYRGRILAHNGQDNDASFDYKKLAKQSSTDKKLAKSALDALMRLDRIERDRIKPSNLKLMMTFADMQSYE